MTCLVGSGVRQATAIAGQLKFVIRIESIIKDFNIAEREAHSIEKTFTRLDQNFYKPEETVVAFKKYLDEMEASSAYGRSPTTRTH